jgi:membrane fusion protein (multidrug efflux system)
MTENANPPAESTVPQATQVASSGHRIRGLLLLLATLALLAFGIWWGVYRWNHSITDDAFVQSRLVNLAPMVPGHAAEILVEEGQSIRWGEVLARIDPLPYEREVEIARSKLAVAEAELQVRETSLARLRETVPVRIAIAEAELKIAQDDQRKAQRALELTNQDVDKGIDAAQAELQAASAVLTNAKEDYRRYSNLFEAQSVSLRRFEEATKDFKTAEAGVGVAQAKLAQAQASRNEIEIAREELSSAGRQQARAQEAVALARIGQLEIEEAQRQVEVARRAVTEADRNLSLAVTRLGYTTITAPFDGVVVKRYRNLGDYVTSGAPILTVFNPELVYVTANLEETRLEGVAPGNEVEIHIDAFWRPFRGRVLWIGSATSANFSLIPRDVSSGEFTKIVQRVPVRIWIEKDERWPLLKPGLSATIYIAHGPGDPEWAAQAAAEQLAIERQAAPPFSMPPERGEAP